MGQRQLSEYLPNHGELVGSGIASTAIGKLLWKSIIVPSKYYLARGRGTVLRRNRSAVQVPADDGH